MIKYIRNFGLEALLLLLLALVMLFIVKCHAPKEPVELKEVPVKHVVPTKIVNKIEEPYKTLNKPMRSGGYRE